MENYRPMRRFAQSLSKEECESLLKTIKRGVLSVIGDGGAPYGVPLNFYFDEESYSIFFHGAKVGHAVDSLRKDNRASFCIMDEGVKLEGDWAFTVKSVILFGKIEFVEDLKKTEKACRAIAGRFDGGSDYIDKEIEKALSRVQVLELHIEHITGKRIHEA